MSRFMDTILNPVASPSVTLRSLDAALGRKAKDLAPFISVTIIVIALLALVFCKMEVRRMGYSVLKLSRAERNMRDQERERSIQLAKVMRPERLQSVAKNRLTLKKPESGQIIQMTERGIALRQ
jgi:hypothetical protein